MRNALVMKVVQICIYVTILSHIVCLSVTLLHLAKTVRYSQVL